MGFATGASAFTDSSTPATEQPLSSKNLVTRPELLSQKADAYIQKYRSAKKLEALFQKIAGDNSGAVSKDKLLRFVKECRGGTLESRIEELFRILDTDGNGSLDLHECRLLHYLLSRPECHVCRRLITDHGFMTCSECFDDESGDISSYNECSACHEANTTRDPEDPHFMHQFEYVEDILTYLTNPQRRKTRRCVCCGIRHDKVETYTGPAKSFLTNDTKHMKKLDGSKCRYVCEFCAKFLCSGCGEYSWDTNLQVEGLWTTQCCHPKCQRKGKEGQYVVDCAAVLTGIQERKGAGSCRACVRRLQLGEMVVHNNPLLHLCGTSGLPPDMRVRCVSWRCVFQVHTRECACCGERHDCSCRHGYFGAFGSGRHMKKLEDGRYLCELCAKWICAGCGVIEWDMNMPEKGKWSRELWHENCYGMKPPKHSVSLQFLADEINARRTRTSGCRACERILSEGSLVQLDNPLRAQAEAQPALVKQLSITMGQTPAWHMDGKKLFGCNLM